MYFLLATICSAIGLAHTRAHVYSKPYVILGRWVPFFFRCFFFSFAPADCCLWRSTVCQDLARLV